MRNRAFKNQGRSDLELDPLFVTVAINSSPQDSESVLTYVDLSRFWCDPDEALVTTSSVVHKLQLFLLVPQKFYFYRRTFQFILPVLIRVEKTPRLEF